MLEQGPAMNFQARKSVVRDCSNATATVNEIQDKKKTVVRDVNATATVNEIAAT